MKKTVSYCIVLLLLLACFSGCQEPQSASPNTFDRSDLLLNFADGFIRPGYNALQISVDTLQHKADAFVQEPTENKLTELQDSWKEAYLNWQMVNAFNFGPAGENGTRKTLLEEIAIFPVSVSKINAILNGQAFNINDFNRDARGFLAIEFLIFNPGGNKNLVLISFENNARKAYLSALCAHLSQRILEVSSAWNGEYRNAFLKSNGTESGSSVSNFYNEFVKSFEAAKNFKIALPLGKRPGQTSADSTLLEARYSGESLRYFKAHIQNLIQIWNGKPYNSDGEGVGFKTYLNNVEGGKELVVSTQNQMAELTRILNLVPEKPTLSQQLFSNPQPLENVLTEMQKQTRFFKSDMASILGIAITYSSGDGD